MVNDPALPLFAGRADLQMGDLVHSIRGQVVGIGRARLVFDPHKWSIGCPHDKVGEFFRSLKRYTATRVAKLHFRWLVWHHTREDIIRLITFQRYRLAGIKLVSREVEQLSAG